MQEVFEVIVSLAITFGFFYLIFLFLRSKYRNAKKWAECRRWARSQGYALPKKSNPIFNFIAIIIGFCFFLLPGLILLYMSWKKDQQYEKEMRALMNKWIDAGKPLPTAK